jgi:hypothetical protein
MYRTWLLIALAFLSASALAEDPPAPRRVTLKFGHQEPEPFNTHRWLFSPEVVADKDGTVRLARSTLLADETGATDHQQSESLSDQVWARKIFQTPNYDRQATPRGAELFIYGRPREIALNGNPLDGAKQHESTGWTRVKLPVDAWKTNDTANTFGHYQHEVVLKGGGEVLFEPRERPALSSRSLDGGKTWSADALGPRQASTGEYLVRMRLRRPPREGWIMSPVLDFWNAPAGELAAPAKLLCLRASGELFQGRFATEMGTRSCLIRTGSTPLPNDRHWTGWHPLFESYEPEANVAHHRWFQLRLPVTAAVISFDRSPAIPKAFALEYELRSTDSEPEGRYTVMSSRKAEYPAQTSIPFVYEKPTPRLKHLREKYELDKVIAPGKTEMEQLMLLRHWVRNQWHTAWGNHPAAWMPPWDALQVLGCKDQPDCLTMCTHYACVFTQCCLALGWNARHCILDHHCTAEVWVDQHQKWVMMDSGNSPTRPDCNLHFERNGVPQSALELHLAYRDKKSDGLTVCFTPKRLMDAIASMCRKPPEAHTPGSPRPDTVSIAELKDYPVCGLENYRRYAFPARNNYLTSLYPGELYQGWAEYFHDGYWWVGDDRDDPQLSPEYSKHLPPSRPQDIDWDLNWTRIHLCRTARPGELQVDLETLTPNLERLELASVSGSEWKPTPASFTWKLAAGKNVLRARGVNAWGRAGKPAEITVEWKP